MFFPFYIFFILLFNLFGKPHTDACGCTPTRSSTYRHDAKYEKDAEKYPEHSGLITSQYVRDWEKLYRNKMKNVFEYSPRVKNTPEDSLYTLSGVIYAAEMNLHDCDLHLEIGTDYPNVLRTVAEIPKDNCKLQDEVMQQLKAKGFIIGSQNSKGVKCTLKGLGFYDGKHPLKKSKKYEQGSAWEIHPVISIELE